MALIERFFPVEMYAFNFFDRIFAEMEREFMDMDQEMARMRGQMHQLVPMHTSVPRDIKDVAIHPSLPIVEEKGQTKLKLEFDVHKFKPEEVKVKVIGDNILQVEAIHETKTDTTHEQYSYFRQYQLPKGVDANQVKPSLTKDGVLTIEAPAPALKPQERLVPIDFKKDEGKKEEAKKE